MVSHTNKDQATKPPLEKPGGEGWLLSPEQPLLCQFKVDSATVHAQADGPAQRHRGGDKML
ncbi:hypothetical protein KR100_09795 [Synechococcus sp. KORDI-100]|uniref:hypothetical protein n=1 Tax=Synechococcus sp. KORDI-100 TaxID=1280380 RepID=UPI0004E0AC11|nr:hypothetical protein [Synechococcus sp. KORDI-100]AII43652.1 hypothetical protein KR100_09795 [Synechococcus sp. KORDI-100]